MGACVGAHVCLQYFQICYDMHKRSLLTVQSDSSVVSNVVCVFVVVVFVLLLTFLWKSHNRMSIQTIQTPTRDEDICSVDVTYKRSTSIEFADLESNLASQSSPNDL